MLDVVRLEWSQFENVPNNQPRLWHRACFTSERDLLIFGGCANDILSNNESSVSLTYFTNLICHLSNTFLSKYNNKVQPRRICKELNRRKNTDINMNSLVGYAEMQSISIFNLPHGLFQSQCGL